MAVGVADEAQRPPRGEAGQFAYRRDEKRAIAAEQRAHQHGDGQRARGAHAARELGEIFVVAHAEDGHGRLIAGFARDALRALGAQPIAARGEIGERARRRAGEFIAQGGRQIVAVCQRLAQLRVFAKALERAPQGAGPEIGVEIARERDHRRALADLGERRGEAGGKAGPAGDRGLSDDVADRGAIDQLRFAERRRAAEHDGGDLALIGGERQHDVARRLRRARQGFGQRPAHQRRRVVEHGREAEFDLGARLGRQIGIEIGAGERAHRFSASLRVGPLREGEKSAHDPGVGAFERGRPCVDGGEGFHGLLRGAGDAIIAYSSPI